MISHRHATHIRVSPVTRLCARLRARLLTRRPARSGAPRPRPGLAGAVSAMVVSAAVVGACGGGQSAQEAVLERMVESETGGDIDLDIGDDGTFTLQSEDGEFSVSVDGEGNADFSSAEGSGTFSADDGQMTFEGEDGSATVEVDADGDGDGGFTVTSDGREVLSGEFDDSGDFSVTDDEGDTIVGQTDDDGFTVVDADGETTFDSGTSIPDAWPDDVPRPEGLDGVEGVAIDQAGEAAISVSGSTDDGAAWLAAYSDAVLAAGFEDVGSMSMGEEGEYFGATRGDALISATWTSDGGTDVVTVVLAGI